MKFGIYEKALREDDLLQSLIEAKELGFDFWEMSIDPQKKERLEWSFQEIAKITEICQKAEMPIYNIVLSLNREYPLGSKSIQIRTQGIEYVKKAIQLASKIGSRTIQLAGYYTMSAENNDGSLENYIQSLKELVRCASENGIILGIENMDYDIIDGKAMQTVIQAVQSPFLQAFPDVGNFEANGLSAITSLELNINNIVGIHLKETNHNVYRRVIFGEGIVDFKEIFAYLRQKNIDGYFGVEMWNDNCKDSTLIIEKAISYLKSQIEMD